MKSTAASEEQPSVADSLAWEQPATLSRNVQVTEQQAAAFNQGNSLPPAAGSAPARQRHGLQLTPQHHDAAGQTRQQGRLLGSKRQAAAPPPTFDAVSTAAGSNVGNRGRRKDGAAVDQEEHSPAVPAAPDCYSEALRATGHDGCGGAAGVRHPALQLDGGLSTSQPAMKAAKRSRTAAVPDVGRGTGSAEPPPRSPAVEIQLMLRQLPKNDAESMSQNGGPAPWHTISVLLSPAQNGGSAALAQLASGVAAAGSSGAHQLAGPSAPAIHAPAAAACTGAAPSDAREDPKPSCLQAEGKAAAAAELADAGAGAAAAAAGVEAADGGAVEAVAGIQEQKCATGIAGGVRQAASAVTSGSHQHPEQLSSLALGPVMPLSQLVWQFGASDSDNSSARAPAGSAKQKGGEDGEEVSSSGVSHPGPCQSQGSCRPAADQPHGSSFVPASPPDKHTSMMPPPARAAGLRQGNTSIQKAGGREQHSQAPARVGASISQRHPGIAAGPAFSWGDPSIMPAALAAGQWYGSSGIKRRLLNLSHQAGQQEYSSQQQHQQQQQQQRPSAEQQRGTQPDSATRPSPQRPQASALPPLDRQDSSEALVAARPASTPHSASSTGPGQMGAFSWGDPTLLGQPVGGIQYWHGTKVAQDLQAAAVVGSSGFALGWAHPGAGSHRGQQIHWGAAGQLWGRANSTDPLGRSINRQQGSPLAAPPHRSPSHELGSSRPSSHTQLGRSPAGPAPPLEYNPVAHLTALTHSLLAAAGTAAEHAADLAARGEALLQDHTLTAAWASNGTAAAAAGGGAAMGPGRGAAGPAASGQEESQELQQRAASQGGQGGSYVRHPSREVAAVLALLQRASVLPVTLEQLKASGLARAMRAVARHPIPLLAEAASALLLRWQALLLEEVRQALAQPSTDALQGLMSHVAAAPAPPHRPKPRIQVWGEEQWQQQQQRARTALAAPNSQPPLQQEQVQQPPTQHAMAAQQQQQQVPEQVQGRQQGQLSAVWPPPEEQLGALAWPIGHAGQSRVNIPLDPALLGQDLGELSSDPFAGFLDLLASEDGQAAAGTPPDDLLPLLDSPMVDLSGLWQQRELGQPSVQQREAGAAEQQHMGGVLVQATAQPQQAQQQVAALHDTAAVARAAVPGVQQQAWPQIQGAPVPALVTGAPPGMAAGRLAGGDPALPQHYQWWYPPAVLPGMAGAGWGGKVAPMAALAGPAAAAAGAQYLQPGTGQGVEMEGWWGEQQLRQQHHHFHLQQQQQHFQQQRQQQYGGGGIGVGGMGGEEEDEDDDLASEDDSQLGLGHVPAGAVGRGSRGRGRGLGRGRGRGRGRGNGGASAGGQQQQQRRKQFSQAETQVFVATLRQHGRDFGRLMEALPGRTEKVLRNFWANHRKRLGLDQVLQEAGFEGRRYTRRAATQGS